MRKNINKLSSSFSEKIRNKYDNNDFEIVESKIDGSGRKRRVKKNTGVNDEEEIFNEKEIFTYFLGMFHIFLMVYCFWEIVNKLSLYLSTNRNEILCDMSFFLIVFFVSLYFLKRNYIIIEKMYVNKIHKNEKKYLSLVLRSGGLILFYYSLFSIFSELLQYYYHSDKNISYVSPFVLIVSYYFFKKGIPELR